MEYRRLPQTDLEVSRLCLGTMTFGDQADEAASKRMVDQALEAGVNFIDTANVYNEGRSEEIVGRALAGRRDQVVLASKAFGKMPGPPPYQGLSRAALETALEASLRRLQTDRLDIYYLHQPDYGTEIEETLETLDAFRRAGKIRYAAVSNYAAWQVGELIHLAAAKGWPEPRISQPMYNLLARGIEQEYMAFAKRYEVSLVVYNPLAGGLLTGKQNPSAGPLPGTRFDGNKRYLDRYWHDAYFQAVESFRALAEKAGRPMIEIAFRWLLDKSAVHSVIVGASKPEQLATNLETIDAAPLDEETLAGCDEIWDALRGPTPFYNR